MRLFNKLPFPEQRHYCDIYEYLHTQNILLDRVLRQLTHKKHALEKKRKKKKKKKRRHSKRQEENKYLKAPRALRFLGGNLFKNHQVWTQDFSNQEQNKKTEDKYSKLVKRELNSRPKREESKTRPDRKKINMVDEWMKAVEKTEPNLVFNFG